MIFMSREIGIDEEVKMAVAILIVWAFSIVGWLDTGIAINSSSANINNLSQFSNQYGIAIVSTPEGIRGFPLVDGESVLVAHNKEQFAAHAVTLLTDPVRRARLGAAARKVALSTIDWKILGKRLVRIIDSVYEGMSQRNKE